MESESSRPSQAEPSHAEPSTSLPIFTGLPTEMSFAASMGLEDSRGFFDSAFKKLLKAVKVVVDEVSIDQLINEPRREVVVPQAIIEKWFRDLQKNPRCQTNLRCLGKRCLQSNISSLMNNPRWLIRVRL